MRVLSIRLKAVAIALPLAIASGVRADALEPTLWADVPDLAMCRVGARYYMVSTTMHFNPGIPVMVSTNLVDWTVASHCYQTLEDRPEDRLEGGHDDYGYGTWAASIRYNDRDGFFYVASFNDRINATYLFRTKDPARGDWQRFRFGPRAYDASLWIEDGKLFLFATERRWPGDGNAVHPGAVRLYRIRDDLSGFVDGGEVILHPYRAIPGLGYSEGVQVLKRDGWYYVVNICKPRGRCRLVLVHRSRTMRGPWEGKVVFEREGIAQGSFIDAPDGKWYAYLFGDRGAVGRCPYVLPVTWKDGWPVIDAAPLPRTKGVPGIVASDDFGDETLKAVWQWNHNPVDSLWSLVERPGWLRLRSDRLDADLLTARNTLTQRCWGPTCVAVTKIDISNLKEDDRAGLALFQRDYAAATVVRESGGEAALSLVCARQGKSHEVAHVNLAKGLREVWLKATGDFTRFPKNDFTGIAPGADTGRFFYSEDGVDWLPLGDGVRLVYTMPHFTGYRFGLFMWSAKASGGSADFDFLRLE